METLKTWKAVRADIDSLRADGYLPEVVRGEGEYADFIAEVSFTRQHGGLLQGETFGSDQCTQGLLRRMAEYIEKKDKEAINE